MEFDRLLSAAADYGLALSVRLWQPNFLHSFFILPGKLSPPSQGQKKSTVKKFHDACLLLSSALLPTSIIAHSKARKCLRFVQSTAITSHNL